MKLAERKPVDIFLRRAAGEFGLAIVLDSGAELAIALSIAQYVDLRDNEGIRVEFSNAQLRAEEFVNED